MKLRLSNLKAGVAYEETGKIEFKVSQYNHVFTLRKINDTTVKVTAHDYNGIIEVRLNIIADLTLACSYSLEDVSYKLRVEEVLEFSSNDLSEDMLPISGNEIELDEYVLSIIVASIPLRVKKAGAKVIEVEDVKVIREDEFKKKEKEKTDPRLKALDDWEE